MPPEITPDEMAELQPESEGPGDITKIAQTAGQALSKLADVVNNSPATTDANRQKASQLLEQFIDFVENDLAGQPPGEDAPPEEEPMPPNAPAMGGMKGVPMGPHLKQ